MPCRCKAFHPSQLLWSAGASHPHLHLQFLSTQTSSSMVVLQLPTPSSPIRSLLPLRPGRTHPNQYQDFNEFGSFRSRIITMKHVKIVSFLVFTRQNRRGWGLCRKNRTEHVPVYVCIGCNVNASFFNSIMGKLPQKQSFQSRLVFPANSQPAKPKLKHVNWLFCSSFNQIWHE